MFGRQKDIKEYKEVSNGDFKYTKARIHPAESRPYTGQIVLKCVYF